MYIQDVAQRPFTSQSSATLTSLHWQSILPIYVLRGICAMLGRGHSDVTAPTRAVQARQYCPAASTLNERRQRCQRASDYSQSLVLSEPLQPAPRKRRLKSLLSLSRNRSIRNRFTQASTNRVDTGQAPRSALIGLPGFRACNKGACPC